MLELVESGEVDAIVIYRIDRFVRSLSDFMQIWDVLQKHGVALKSATEDFDTSTQFGQAMLKLLVVFAELERGMACERQRDKVAAMRSKGMITGGCPVLGYDIINSKLELNPDEAEVVKRIFTMYLDDKSGRDVAQKLNEEGVTQKKWIGKKGQELGGKKWTDKAINGVLHNIKYIGKISHQPRGATEATIYDGQHEPIIKEKAFKEAQQKLKANARRIGATSSRGKVALLKGTVYCENCGERMTPSHSNSRHSKSKKFNYYICQRAVKQGYNLCDLNHPHNPPLSTNLFQLTSNPLNTVAQEPLSSKFSASFALVSNFEDPQVHARRWFY